MNINYETATKEELLYAEVISDLIALLCKDDPTIVDLEEALKTFKNISTDSILRAYYTRKTQILKEFINKYGNETSRH